MIIITTIAICYSIVISCLTFYCQKKLKNSLLENDKKRAEFDNININLERAKSEIQSLQNSNVIKEESIKNHASKILELSSQNASLFTSEKSGQEANAKLECRITSLQNEINSLNAQNSTLSANEATVKEREANLKTQIEAQKTFVEEAQKNLRTEFEKIAADHLKTNSKEFLENSSLKLTDILKPYAEGIEALKTKVESTYDKESKERFSLGEQVKNLLNETNKISAEANNLASALKGQSKKQGNWGEMILETILQNSGLMEGYQYDKEKNIKGDEGQNLRPDFIVKLPDNRVVIIDSKTSLVGYEKFSSEESSGMQELYLKEHLASMKNHIDSLSSKKYDDLETSLDFTLMFIPIEPAYLVAMQYDPELWNYAYKKRILLISSTNLIACLKLINELWRREEQSKNQAEILRQVGELYDKFVGFVESLTKVGKQIKLADTTYEEAIKQLNSGKGSLITRVENIKKLGIKTSKSVISNSKISNKILPNELQEDEMGEELELDNLLQT